MNNLLLQNTQDALLHAIKEEYVEAVEILLQHEEKSHVAGQAYVMYKHDGFVFFTRQTVSVL